MSEQTAIVAEPILFSSHTTTNEPPTSEHDAIVQTLDRNVGGVQLTREMFESSLSSWDGIPLVFAQDHPDMQLYDANPEAALAAVNGRHVGTFSNPHIKDAGHPRLWGKFNFTDPEMRELVNSGQLSLSTAFWAMKDQDKYVSTKPQNILVFRETDTDLPRDLGTGILNKHHSNPNKSDTERTMTDGNESTEVASKLVAMTNKFEEVTEKLTAEESKNKALSDEIAQNKETIAALEKEVQTFKEAEQNAKWDALKNMLPRGMIHDEAATEAARKEWESDPHGFAFKIAQAASKVPAGTEVDGVEFKQAGKPEAEPQQFKEGKEIYEKLGLTADDLKD